MSEHRYYHISRTGRLTRLATLSKALSLIEKQGFLWLDYCETTKEELSVLIDPLGLHPLSIEDCVDENQIPKIDDYPKNTFILFNAFDYSNRELSITEVDIFIGKKFLVTVSRRDSGNRSVLKDLEHIVRFDIENARQGPAFLLHVLLDHVVDQKFLAIEALEEELNNHEDLILSDISHFNPAELLHLRRELLALRKSLFHEREIMVKICRNDCLFIPEKSIFFYRDIYDHLSKFFELTESSRDVVSSLMEIYLSMLNNQMARAANNTNKTIRRLTLITTVFMPLSFLAGIGGMSEWSMMTGPANWRIAYPLFLAGMAVIGGIMFLMLRRYGKMQEGRHAKRAGRR